MKNALIIFIKNPVPGKVKTRLARTIGEEKALAVYQKLVAHTQAICEKVDVDKFVYYSDFLDDINEWKDCEPLLQSGIHLGERMENAFNQLFEDPAYEKAVIIGSDCYELTAEIIKEAFTRLNHYDVVIGPAFDGGYYLLGMKQLHTALFENKTWSTSTVLQQTISDLNQLQISYFLLPELSDIDEEKDLAGTQLLEG